MTRGSLDGRIADLAARQHGVFTRVQALRCGATDNAIKHRLKTGRWERVHARVYRLAGSPRTWKQEAIAACFHSGPRSVISFRAAATLRGLTTLKRSTVEIIVPRNRHRSGLSGIKIHWLREPVPDEDIGMVDGIPVTKPARTLLDLATVEPQEVIERCLDDCLRRRLVSLPFLDRWLEDARRKRHRGYPMLRRLVDERARTGVTESPLEAQVLKLLRDAGLPLPMLQYVIKDGDRFVGRVDFAYPEQRVVIEAEGFGYHDNDRQRFDAERARGNDIEAMGWTVLRITSKHLEEDPDAVVRWVRDALDQAR